jgi:large subunit ribosomal protein L4
MAAPKAPVLDAAGKKAGEHSLEAAIFAVDVKRHLVFETVRAEAAARRSGTKALKSRGLVSGGRTKPWRQKGTGRARAGTTRAVQWTGGGAAFQPRTNFEVKVNRKERKAALRGALSDLAGRAALAVVDGSQFDAPSTKRAAALIDAWGQERPLLVIADETEEALIKSFRNLERVLVTVPHELAVSELVWARSALVTEAALPLVEQRAADRPRGVA